MFTCICTMALQPQEHAWTSSRTRAPKAGRGGTGPSQTDEEHQGDPWAVGTQCFPLTSSLGGALACGGSTGPAEHHQPPLIFNLDRDIQEQEPLDVASREYEEVLPAISRAYTQALEDIATDNVSVADYSKDPAVTPCCDPQHVACRCHAPGAHRAVLDHRMEGTTARLVCL